MKVAIPQSGDDVAPCVGHCALMTIYTITGDHITDRVEFPLRSQEPFDRVRLLRDQKVDTIICGGVQDVLEECLRGCGIEVISWVTGRVDSLLELFLRGQLVPGHVDESPPTPETPSHPSP